MTITFKKTSVSRCYRVYVNGRSAGRIDKDESTGRVWWIYQCKGDAAGQPVLSGVNRRREWAVQNAVLDILTRASDVKEYFAL